MTEEECSIKFVGETGSSGSQREDLSHFEIVAVRYPISLIHWPPRPSDLLPPSRQDPRTFSRPGFRHHRTLQLEGIPPSAVGEVEQPLGTAPDGEMCLNIDCGVPIRCC